MTTVSRFLTIVDHLSFVSDYFKLILAIFNNEFMQYQRFKPLDHFIKEPSKVKFQPSSQPYYILQIPQHACNVVAIYVYVGLA